ncbi:MAG: hypothetical protein J0H24_22735, partial [Delftia acidovorans]|nr:hypothetical protein [Delftia acidovorans]
VHLLVPLTFAGLGRSFWHLYHGNIAGHRKIMRSVYIGACIVAGLYGTGLSLPDAGRASAMRRTGAGRVPDASGRRELQESPWSLEDCGYEECAQTIAKVL